MKAKRTLIATLFILSYGLSFSAQAMQGGHDLSYTISEYRKALAERPVDYSLLETKQLLGARFEKFRLNSQSWSLQGRVSPSLWQHEVDIYIPYQAHDTNALVVINSGCNNDGTGNPVAPTNFTQAQLYQIAIKTKTVVISISNVPNQKLTYLGVNTPLAEDDSVAWAWKLFINDPKKDRQSSLHIPMSAAVSQGLRLAKKELAPQRISKFILTGASKRGWAAWLTALSDPDVVAIIPFAMDLLNTQQSLKHMYYSYGNNWPIAFYPYYQREIDKHIESSLFSQLMKIEDPLAYPSNHFQQQLEIDKYIINASGDDFYVPDNSRFYYDKLPGKKSLRVVENSGHHGILSAALPSLITFVNRYQEKKPMPEINEVLLSDKNNRYNLKVNFSEQPTSIVQWTAHNPAARDFRFACDIQYHPTPVSLDAESKDLELTLITPANGWQATYLEATFSDGYVATSQVYILPDTYPAIAPPSKGLVCQTLPGRGLIPDEK